jgi:hypothetical protein
MNKTTLRRHDVQAIESRKYKQRGHKQNRLFSTLNTYIACHLYYFFQALEQACQTQTAVRAALLFLKRKKSSAGRWFKNIQKKIQANFKGKDDNFENFHGNFEGSISKGRLFRNGYFEINFENGCLHYVHWELCYNVLCG